MSAYALAVQSPNSPVDVLPRLLRLELLPLPFSCTVYLVQGEGDRRVVQISIDYYSKRNKTVDRAPGS